MIKELILAITLGALLGFGLTGGYIAIKNSKTVGNAAQTIPTPAPEDSANKLTPEQVTPTPTDDNNSTNSHQIVIESPENESVVTNSQISLKGSTSPQSQLIIITPIKTYFASADNAGNFSVDVEIESGVNLIQFESIDLQDNQTSIQLTVTYSTAKF